MLQIFFLRFLESVIPEKNSQQQTNQLLVCLILVRRNTGVKVELVSCEKNLLLHCGLLSCSQRLTAWWFTSAVDSDLGPAGSSESQ